MLLPTSPDEPWPSKRSFHTACTLIDPDLISTNTDTNKSNNYWSNKGTDSFTGFKGHFLLRQNLLLLWGNDNNGDVVKDCWILEIEAKQGNAPKWKWKKVYISMEALMKQFTCSLSSFQYQRV